MDDVDYGPVMRLISGWREDVTVKLISFRSGDTRVGYADQWTSINGSENDLMPIGAKPLCKPMLIFFIEAHEINR